MRNLVLFIMIMIVIGMHDAYGEEMVREGYVWKYGEHVYGPLNLDGGHIAYNMQFYGEEIIGGKTYKKLYRYYDDELDVNKKQPLCYMRQEGSKVYGILNTEYVPEMFEGFQYLNSVPCSLPTTEEAAKEKLMYDLEKPWEVYKNTYKGESCVNENFWREEVVDVNGHESIKWSYLQNYPNDGVKSPEIIAELGRIDCMDISSPVIAVWGIEYGKDNWISSSYLLTFCDAEGNVLYDSGIDFEQTIFPTLEDGMKFVYQVEDEDNNANNYKYVYEIGGDFIFDRKASPETRGDFVSYKKVFRYAEGEKCEETPVAYLQEGVNTLFVRLADSKDFKPLYCYSREGAKSIGWEQAMGLDKYESLTESKIDIAGHERNVLTDSDGNKYIEGIGADGLNVDLLNPIAQTIATHKSFGLHHVENSKGEIIYKGKRYREAGVEDITGDVEKEVRGVRYYNMLGVESAEPFSGVNVKVTTYSDGTRSAEKVLR